MRLIHCPTLQLVEFFDENIPEYAILSHAWEPGEEVSFPEMTEITKVDTKTYPTQQLQLIEENLDQASTNRVAGCKKIRFTVAEARSEHIDYIWIDTCCIDKSSSSELSEAINSMYTWYNRARICFVYLNDVSISTSSFANQPDDWDERTKQLSESRWLTGGWTLQELIAPRDLQFYNKYGNFISNINVSLYTLSNLTGIDGSVLESSDPSGISVAARMCWAAKRKTSRGEDLAYCLMGIFSINMPMLYGEGFKRAFIRLQEEILKTSDDRSIFYWTNPTALPSTFSGLLASTPAYFHTYFGPRIVPDARTYRTTNKGIKINLHLVPRPSSRDEFYGIFEHGHTCRDEWSPWGIHLKKLDHNIYSRVDATRFWEYNKGQVQVLNKSCPVYVPQNPLLLPYYIDLTRIRGIHVDTPTAPLWEWEEADGCHQLGSQLLFGESKPLKVRLLVGTDTADNDCHSVEFNLAEVVKNLTGKERYTYPDPNAKSAPFRYSDPICFSIKFFCDELYLVLDWFIIV